VETAMNRLRNGEVPVAIISDLFTEEHGELYDGQRFLSEVFDEASSHGIGIWTVLVSGNERKLDEFTKNKDRHKQLVPTFHCLKNAGWQERCVSKLRPLFSKTLPSDAENPQCAPIVPYKRSDGETRDYLAPKD